MHRTIILSKQAEKRALLVYLYWLKTGSNQESIAAFLQLKSRKEIHRYINQCVYSLQKVLVPDYLGNQTRDFLLDQELTAIAKKFNI
ncbi:hypothetical protein BpHYR1_001112 [Brachionus plicatilis]|uniref:Uncharacterized protein n=1 Tax=Brachionus plicatilis TaxID=10195 RepID=A0A3M7S7L5_BRAPC|nr:hypothetical protein BpHYR1_001112 [Brachionus plicatilis]